MSAKGSFVYVIKDDSTAELRPVRLGQRQDELVVVDQGLQSGDRVVTSGHLAVMPGAKVRVEETGTSDHSQATGKEQRS
jgi:multidrug efflux system membrane fusion protein